MIDEELLNKFDRIQDLPVSEEMLGAYLENSLTDNVAIKVNSIIEDSGYLTSLIKTIQSDLNTEDLVHKEPTVLDGILDWMDIELPEVTNSEISGLESFYVTHSSGISEDDLFFSGIHGNDIFLSDDDSFNVGNTSLDTDDIL